MEALAREFSDILGGYITLTFIRTPSPAVLNVFLYPLRVLPFCLYTYDGRMNVMLRSFSINDFRGASSALVQSMNSMFL